MTFPTVVSSFSPFYYVQLAAFSQLNFAGVKLAQSNVNKTLKNTGMVVISDVSLYTLYRR